jgi:hypothetical protein
MNRLPPIALMALAAFVVSGCAGSGSYYAGGYAYDPYWPFRHYYYPYFHHFRVPWPRYYYPYPLRYPRPGYWPSYRPDHRSDYPFYHRPGSRPGQPGVRPGRPRGERPEVGPAPGGPNRVRPAAPAGFPRHDRGRRHLEQSPGSSPAQAFRPRGGDGGSRSGSPPARTFDAPRPGSDDGGRPRRGGFGGGHRPRRP